MNFKQRFATSVTGLIAGSILILLAGFSFSTHEVEFFPGTSSELDWFASIEPPEPAAENYVEVLTSGEQGEVARFAFYLSPTQALPFTSFTIYLANPTSVDVLRDLSAYSDIRFSIQCDPKNILVFALYSYVPGVTSIDMPETYRVSSDFFTCNSQWKEVNFPLRNLDSAIWWVERYGIRYNDLEADLRHVHGFAFNNSLQSPTGIESKIAIKDLKLIEEHALYLYASIGVVIFMWLIGSIALTRLYISEVLKTAKAKLNDNRPLVAYQQLSLQQKDESLKTKLFQHIAVEYCNPDLTIDGVAETLGTNRVKINEILKSEMGLTFTVYINRLRLTEAARLLALKHKLSVKQIAFEVGFSNVSYFNTLFKKEYGCTPKAFADSAKARA